VATIFDELARRLRRTDLLLLRAVRRQRARPAMRAKGQFWGSVITDDEVDELLRQHGEIDWDVRPDGLDDAIAASMAQLDTLAQPTKGVYVSCDGVVCAAKSKQQRLRRFKGPWIAAAEAAVKREAGAQDTGTEERWDQNALTPGSAFMERLGGTLIDAGRLLAKKTSLKVHVSTTSEPGEGEHKLLAHMRSVRPTTCTIYGLDADLILLSMLLRVDTGADVRLMREAQEFERGGGEGEWRSLDVSSLASITLNGKPERVRDYVAAMSLLGNDFLPRSLTHTVRDDGIPFLIRSLEKSVWGAGLTLVGEDGGLRRDALLALLRPWAAMEEQNMLACVKDAVKGARRPAGIGANPEETALREFNAQPARWCAVKALLDPRNPETLIPGWRDLYRGVWRSGHVGDYVAGLAWTWDYYSGRPVDLGWFYEAHLPPLWSDVVAALETRKDVAPPPLRFTEPLVPWLHLLSVLPADSVRSLLPANRQIALKKAPWYWPTSWSLFDVGRSQIWECEPVIPVPSESVVRGWAELK
jgi:5'-3' exonuclease